MQRRRNERQETDRLFSVTYGSDLTPLLRHSLKADTNIQAGSWVQGMVDLPRLTCLSVDSRPSTAHLPAVDSRPSTARLTYLQWVGFVFLVFEGFPFLSCL